MSRYICNNGLNKYHPPLCPSQSMDFGESGDSESARSGCFLCMHLQMSLYPPDLGCPERLPMTLLPSLFGLVHVQPPLARGRRGTPGAPPPPLSPCQYCLCTLLSQERVSSPRGDGHHHRGPLAPPLAHPAGRSVTVRTLNHQKTRPCAWGQGRRRAECSACAHFSKHRSSAAANSTSVIISPVPFLFRG